MVPRRDEPARRACEGVAGTTSSPLDAADVQAAMPPAWLWIAGGNPYLRIPPWYHPLRGKGTAGCHVPRTWLRTAGGSPHLLFGAWLRCSIGR